MTPQWELMVAINVEYSYEFVVLVVFLHLSSVFLTNNSAVHDIRFHVKLTEKLMQDHTRLGGKGFSRWSFHAATSNFGINWNSEISKRYTRTFILLPSGFVAVIHTENGGLLENGVPWYMGDGWISWESKLHTWTKGTYFKSNVGEEYRKYPALLCQKRPNQF